MSNSSVITLSKNIIAEGMIKNISDIVDLYTTSETEENKLNNLHISCCFCGEKADSILIKKHKKSKYFKFIKNGNNVFFSILNDLKFGFNSKKVYNVICSECIKKIDKFLQPYLKDFSNVRYIDYKNQYICKLSENTDYMKQLLNQYSYIDSNKHDLLYGDSLVNIKSDRYIAHLNSDFKCSCGIQGSEYRLEINKSGCRSKNHTRYHFNLYGQYENNSVMLTKDHIVPKFISDNDSVDNLQCLCTLCNSAKADFFNPECFSKDKKNALELVYSEFY